MADDIIETYGVDEKRFMDALAKISVINYSNGTRNPNVQTRKWFTDQAQAENRGIDTNPFVGGRLVVSDCSQVTDGSEVVVLASEKFVREREIRNRKGLWTQNCTDDIR